jgi:hypothetical protein
MQKNANGSGEEETVVQSHLGRVRSFNSPSQR